MPERIGDYRLMDELGRGGMGMVYLAEQETPIRREVALKVIKAGMDTREVILRFEAERQALALMDHPSIARVLDAGVTAEGRPFFVMELVEGLPLTSFCDRERLGVSERLQLMRRVCEAVQHAHQKGILHRDLKPSNILVNRDSSGLPMPKVIDFGIAKAVGHQTIADTLVTLHGQVLGTPQYMSPEQADERALETDTRSDVYALGVMLYELLTGSTPLRPETLRGAALAEVQRLLRDGVVEKPSARLKKENRETQGDDGGCKPPLLGAVEVAALRDTTVARLRSVLSGELDWVVMKALEKDLSRRYGSAAELAEELRRFLENEPVRARPPSALYRLRKTVRRNRAVFAAGLSIAAALVVATVISLQMALRARQAEKLANERLAAAEAVPEFLIHALRSPDPAKSGRDVKVAEVLDQAVAEARSRFATQPLVRARLLETLGQTYHGLGLYDEAAELLGETAASYVEPGEVGRGSEVKNLIAQAIAQRFQGRYESALMLNAEAWEKAKSSLGEDHPDTLHARYEYALVLALMGRMDEAAMIRDEIASGQMGTAAQRLHMTEDLDVLFMESRGELEPLVALYTRRAQQPLYLGKRSHNELASSQMEHLGRVLNKLGRVEESLHVREELLLHTWEALGAGHHYSLNAMRILEVALAEAGRRTEAVALAQRLLAACELETRVSKEVERLKSQVAAWVSSLNDEQLATLKKWEHGQESDGEEVPSILWTASSLAQSEPTLRRQQLEKALASRERETSEPYRLAGPRLRLAQRLISTGELDAAEALLRLVAEPKQVHTQVLAPLLVHRMDELATARGGKAGLDWQERALELALAGSWMLPEDLRLMHQIFQVACQEIDEPERALRSLVKLAPSLARAAQPGDLGQLQTALGMAQLLVEQKEVITATACLKQLAESLTIPSTENDRRRLGLEMEALRLWAELDPNPGGEPRIRLAAQLRAHCKTAHQALADKRFNEALPIVNLILSTASLAKDLGKSDKRPAQEPDLLNLVRRVAVELFHAGANYRPLARSLFEALLPQIKTLDRHPSTRDVLHFLAVMLQDEKRWGEAMTFRKELDHFLTTTGGAEHPETLNNRLQLAMIAFQLGDHDECLKISWQCLRAMEKTRGVTHHETLRCRETLVSRLASAGQKDEALVLNLEQKRLLLEAPTRYPGGYSNCLIKEANILRDFGQWTLAEDLYNEAIRQTPLQAPNEGERNRLQNILQTAINGLESVAKQRGTAFAQPKTLPQVIIRP
jgi:serine/threonine protein kinase